MNDHPEWADLEKLLANQLDGFREQSILEHLSGCDRCMETADEIWGGLAALSEDMEVPEIDPVTQSEVERWVFSRIHRADLATQVARLMTEGLMGVIVALLRPLVAPATDREL